MSFLSYFFSGPVLLRRRFLAVFICLSAGVLNPAFAELTSPLGTESYFLPEVVAIPFNLNTLSDYYIKQIKSNKVDLRRFAASLVERKRLFQERWGNNQTEKPQPGASFISVENVELIAFFPEKYLDSFIKNGQLNVHQTGHSRGLCEPAIRASAEDFMLGIHLEAHYDGKSGSALHYLRPKYGFVNFLQKAGVSVNPNRWLRYGQIVLVYKDEVKFRTTYTYGDSLVSYCEPWEKSRIPIEPAALTCLEPPKAELKQIRYVEAQIWGPLNLSDIKEFRVPSARPDLVEKLDKLGLPVYAYDRESMELCDEFIDASLVGIARGKQLNAALSAEAAKSKETPVY